jgi:1-phosphatidylinositol-4-phosphate 5-kinase
MPHFDEETPSSLSAATGPMLTQNRPPFDLPSHVRHSHEKLNGNARTSSHTSIKTSLTEEPLSYMDGGNSVRLVNGDVFNDTSLNPLANGRSSVSSWDHRSSRNGSTLSVNGLSNASNTSPENGRRSPGPSNGLKRLSNGTERNSGSITSINGAAALPQNSEVKSYRPASTSTSNGDSEPAKKFSLPTPISTAPQSTGPLTYTSSLLPATPVVSQQSASTTIPITPSRAATSSPHRFSSPPTYPVPLNPSPSTHSLPPDSLRHRHTLQVPRPGGAVRNSHDGSDALYSSGRFSPTGAAATSGFRRGSLSLNRRHTQSIHSNMPHDEVPLDEDTMRWAEALKQKRASKRKRKDDEDDDRVVVGTKVDINHVNWVTAYNMLTGIRFTVSRTNAKMDRPLTDIDFDASHKFSFDM